MTIRTILQSAWRLRRRLIPSSNPRQLFLPIAIHVIGIILSGTVIAADEIDVFVIGRTNDGTAVLRYEESQPPNQDIGFFSDTIVDNEFIQLDLATDGNSLFVLESMANGHRIAEYTSDGGFIRSMTDEFPIGRRVPERLIYESGDLFVSLSDAYASRLNSDGSWSSIGGIGFAFDAFPGGVIAVPTSGDPTALHGKIVQVTDNRGTLLSQVVTNEKVHAVAVDDFNSLAFLSNAESSYWGVLDFSDPTAAVLLSQGTADFGFGVAAFDPATGNIFGSDYLEGLVAVDPAGNLVAQFVGGPIGSREGVAVISVPEPSGLNLVSLFVMLYVRRIRSRRSNDLVEAVDASSKGQQSLDVTSYEAIRPPSTEPRRAR